MPHFCNFTQHLCAHGKVARNPTLFAIVPLVKRALENFVFDLRALGGFEIGYQRA